MGPAVFVCAHPDDEMWMAVAIAEHLSLGQDVHVVWVTNGTKSGVLDYLNGNVVSSYWGNVHNPTNEGYQTLDEQTFGEARIRESQNAVRLLGSGFTGILTMHQINLIDSFVTKDDVKTELLTLCNTFPPFEGLIRLKSHTWMTQLDSHNDHINTGLAIKELAQELPTLFESPRYYLLPIYWNDPDLNLVTETFDLPANQTITNSVKNARRAFSGWSPPYTFSCGDHSVKAMLDTIFNTPKCVLHV